MAEREGFYLAIPAILMKPKTQEHVTRCLCWFQALFNHSLACASVSPVNTKTAKKGITRYHIVPFNREVESPQHGGQVENRLALSGLPTMQTESGRYRQYSNVTL
jgi:hypothetical protein